MNVYIDQIYPYLRTFLKTKVNYLKAEIAEVKRVSGKFTMFKY